MRRWLDYLAPVAGYVGARVKIAQLDGSGLARVRALESELGTWVVALEREFCLAESAGGVQLFQSAGDHCRHIQRRNIQALRRQCRAKLA